MHGEPGAHGGGKGRFETCPKRNAGLAGSTMPKLSTRLGSASWQLSLPSPCEPSRTEAAPPQLCLRAFSSSPPYTLKTEL